MKKLHQTIISQMPTPVTSGFGLVTALAITVTYQLAKINEKFLKEN